MKRRLAELLHTGIGSESILIDKCRISIKGE